MPNRSMSEDWNDDGNMDNPLLTTVPEHMDTERLHLRRYESGDGPMYYAAGIRNREHLARFESGNVILYLKDEEHAEAIVRQLAEDWHCGTRFFVGIFDKATGEWAGQVYVAPTNRDLPEFVIGYVADTNYEGKGVISEAVNRVLEALFIELGAHRVTSDCNENNTRSWRLLERCGFRREGHLRENRKNA